MRTAVLAVAALPLIVSPPARAAVLCETHSGTVKIRAACRPAETPVDPVALGLQGPPGPALTVKDANAALVGALVGDGTGDVTVVRQVGSEHLRFTVNEG